MKEWKNERMKEWTNEAKKVGKEEKTINISAALISGRDKGLILRCVLRNSVSCFSISVSLYLSLPICLLACLSLSICPFSILRLSGCVCLCLIVCLFVFVCLCLFLNQNKSLISRRTQYRINFLSQPENRAGDLSFWAMALKRTNPVGHGVISVWLSVQGPSLCPSVHPFIWIFVHPSESLSLSLSLSVCLHLWPNERG